MAKIDKLLSKHGYEWKFSTVGGVTRVNIENGDDIAHLDELDQKLWTVLSCPVTGLEFDERTLSLLDADKDGKLRVHEIVAASQWLKQVLVHMDYLFDGSDTVDFSEICDTTPEGQEVLAAARLILGSLGLDRQSIALKDVMDYMATYEEKCKEGYQAADEPYEPPYGDTSDAVEAAVGAVRAKVADWFMRCRLVQFDEDAAPVLDVQVDKIAAISGNDLSASADEIGTYPLARPSKEGLLPLASGINPAWQGAMGTLVAAVPEWQGKESLSEEEWNEVVGKVDAYTAWKAAGVTAMNEAIAAQVAEHAAAFEPVERLVRYCRDYVRLLHNYVVFKDFYRRDDKSMAVFQAGKLYIDQRCCDLCVKVSDMGKSTATAGKSGMYLIYCHCVAKSGGAQMDIVAALTDGEVGGLHEGKNAIFYDRSGQDWDATVTKIVDNPISVRQAFWSPYRKFGNWVTDKITKSASEKESKQFDEMTAKADTASTNLTAAPAEGAAPAAADKKAAPFDIAKFAGIFAAIGLAFGAIGAALGMLGGFITAKWYNVILLVAAVVILISGPSMLLAWLKLRKRNLGPVLNANGWAINSDVKVNTTFGKTLTSMAKYPKVVAADPFADKKTPLWRRILCWLLILAVAFVLIFRLAAHRWVWQPKPVKQPVAEVVEEPVVVEEAPAAVEAVAEETPAAE
ncbi:MAG: hypothetical protein IJ524_00160 [Bacteroidales bacterium]|nr:hypothetical protein [Bacteroidales bacterium]